MQRRVNTAETPSNVSHFFLLFFSLVLLPASLQAKTIVLPITLDHFLLNTLFKQEYFDTPDNSAQLMDTTNGCNEIKLSHPLLSEKNGHLHFTTDTFVRLGLPLGDSCIMPMQWQGTTDLLLKPYIEEENWLLRFETLEVQLLEGEEKPATVVTSILEQLIPEMKRFMKDFKVDLAPPVDDLRSSLLPLFSEEVQEKTRTMLNSLTPGPIFIDSQGVTLKILTETSEPESSREEPPLRLTREELDRLVKVWETWDSFLIHLVTSLAAERLSRSEKDLLLDLVLQTRHTFVEELQQETLNQDFVRLQFISSWGKLSPLFKKYYLRNPNDNMLAYLSFITASDALTTLDDLGPTMGIEISRNGLIRLLKILNDEKHLNYSEEINPHLRELFNNGKIQPAPEQMPETQQRQDSHHDRYLHFFYNIFISPAFADTPSFKDIQKWKAPRENHGLFLTKVRTLLHQSSTSQLKNSTLPPDLGSFFLQLIPAIAWQESCFRQFVVKNNKLTYLLSYNNTSVGIMQINERVWRGIYQLQRLRWDIHYNAFAGCEIVDLYLRKYILPKATPKLLENQKMLASLVYALYNGGPGQYKKYLKRHAQKNFYDSDKLFEQKYLWVLEQQWNQIDRCL